MCPETEKRRDPGSGLIRAAVLSDTHGLLRREVAAEIQDCSCILHAGDIIRESDTRYIAGAIPGAELLILPGEDHGSYIVHSDRISQIILDFCL